MFLTIVWSNARGEKDNSLYVMDFVFTGFSYIKI